MHRIRAFVASGVLLLTATVTWADEPQHGEFTTSDGIRIHYATQGAAGSWVVLIHGYIDSAERMWFRTGIAEALASNHRVVALDNRNHGKSDKPQPGGGGKAEDVLELMEQLGIEKAHIHGYSMGGGITGRLLASHPDLFITAGFGGSGIYEADEELRKQAADLDPQAPEPKGAAAAAYRLLRQRAAARRKAESAGEGRESAPAAANRRRRSLEIDLTKIEVPVIAINGEFDRPHSKSQRMARELSHFENVILPGRNHMTAVAIGVPMDETYVKRMVEFINKNDVE